MLFNKSFIVTVLLSTISARNTFELNKRNTTYYGQGILENDDSRRARFPYHVILQKEVYPDIFTRIGGGSLISRTMILTAEICFYGYSKENIYATAGVSSFIYKDKAIQHRKIANFIKRPDSGANNDLVIAEVEIPFWFDLFVSHIMIGKIQPPINMTCQVVGWVGDHDNEWYGPRSFRRLKHIDLKIVVEDVCGKRFKDKWNKETMICGAIEMQESIYACSGLPGSALLYDSIQVGVMTAVSHQCGATSPTGFIDVSRSSEWILNMIKNGARSMICINSFVHYWVLFILTFILFWS